MLRQVARLAAGLAFAGAAVPALGVGPAAACSCRAATDADFTVERVRTDGITGTQWAPVSAPTVEPTSEAPDTLGPTTDAEEEDGGGLGGGAAAALGVAAAALIAGGFLLRRYGRT